MLKKFISELPMYCLNETRLYVVSYKNDIIGLGGYKKKDDTVVELKRVYLQKQFRGKGFGRKLVSQLINDAKRFGFTKMFLESADFMEEAYNLYKSFGFVKIPNYQGIETPSEFASNIYCMELELQNQSKNQERSAREEKN
jgi:GNAT superfamily N-acetyltransferase